MSGKNVWIAMAALAMIVAMMASAASADHLAQNARGTHAKLYRAGQSTAEYKRVEQRIHSGHHATGAFVVHHEMQDRIVTKAKAAAATVQPRYIRVRAHNNTLYLDRHADYVNHHQYKKDGQHLLAKAQALGNDRYNTRASVVFGGPVDATMEVKDLQPLMIFKKPSKGVPLNKQMTRK